MIWITVTKKYNILDLQNVVAKEFNVSLGSSSDAVTRKMILSSSSKQMKFLLMLDDMWSAISLQEVLSIDPLDGHKGSKVVISARSKDVIQTMGANCDIEMKRLSPEEEWQLFSRVAGILNFNSIRTSASGLYMVEEGISGSSDSISLGAFLCCKRHVCHAMVEATTFLQIDSKLRL